MKIYIPENLDLELLEEKYQAKETIKHYKRDKLAYILHQLGYISLYDSRYQKEGILIPLSSKIIQQRLGNYYNQYLEFLLQTGIIDTDNRYIKKEKAIGYRIGYPYNKAVRVYEIEDFQFKRNLENYYIESHKKIRREYKHLIGWFDKLEINEAAARQFIFDDFQIKEQFPELRDRDEDGYKSPSIQYKLAQKAIDKYTHKEFLDYTIDQSGLRLH